MPKKTTKKETKKANKVEEFDLEKAIDENIKNPFLNTGFKSFIADKEVTTQKEFNKILTLFMGG